MKHNMRLGWQLAFKHMNMVIVLFLYQLLWGFLVYRAIDDTIAPLLRRFPASAPVDQAVQLFFAEAQFQLFKTDLIQPYLWLFGGLLLARMLITPLFNAGLFYSIHHQTSTGESGTRIIEGIRKTWKPVMLLYWISCALMIAPAWWIVPQWIDALRHNGVTTSLLMELLPGAAIWIAWIALIHLLFLSMQFGAVSGDGIFPSLLQSLRKFLTYAAISLLMWGIAALLGLVFSSISMVWAGLFALIAHQGYPLIKTLLRIWIIAAQYSHLKAGA
ncbi:hypothetical protein D3P08_17410 [Paenibacillus nanensis]|uniref:DUF975 family protein n=1 Tax=Paenibacillus nanensis TaxID=393251 RepID=A0A3A1UTV5_9BACL|nr:hypothetical protein [Paenibacillus nanensis]RIX51246.1 hypothetical protein D3P08_17410 [Paenibacillus nanensis]